jgi:hypothetical protein
MDKSERKYFWAKKGTSSSHEIAASHHQREFERYAEIKVGVTYIAFFSAIAFAVYISIG